jgi:hypothetical protein
MAVGVTKCLGKHAPLLRPMSTGTPR